MIKKKKKENEKYVNHKFVGTVLTNVLVESHCIIIYPLMSFENTF